MPLALEFQSLNHWTPEKSLSRLELKNKAKMKQMREKVRFSKEPIAKPRMC